MPAFARPHVRVGQYLSVRRSPFTRLRACLRTFSAELRSGSGKSRRREDILFWQASATRSGLARVLRRPHTGATCRSRAVSAARSSCLRCTAASAVREQATGIEFAEVADFWQGETFRCLGAGVRQKKFAFVGVKVYAVALYIAVEKAAREIGIRDRGGFFKDASDDDYSTAVIDGAFDKLLQVQLVRTIEGNQFYEALEEQLAPKLQLTGGTDALRRFGDFINSQSLEKGTDILMLWRGSDDLEVVVKPSKSVDYAKVAPDLQIKSVALCRGLFEVFLGSNSVVPQVKQQWAQGVRSLLDSERVQKDTRPGAF